MIQKVVITTFYKFISLSNCKKIRKLLLRFCTAHDLKGTILIAREGINSTISGSREGIDALYLYLKEELGIELSNIKESYADFKPFLRTKVKIKEEIVALKAGAIDAAKDYGEYIKAKEWDEFIKREDVIAIDTRNDYEVKVGTFKGAIDPKTPTFRDFPEWVERNKDIFKDKKVAMFCTGGIRCEKSTAYMKSLGYDDVYHLEGGILKYFEETKNSNKMWEGDCFVFDDRVALTPELEVSSAVLCEKCGDPMSTDDVRETVSQDGSICITCS